LRYPAIDGLRFYAAFVVFLVHLVTVIATEYFGIPQSAFTATSPDYLTRVLYYLADGHHGVDLFFIISGFLVGRMVMKAGQFFYIEFLTKRAARIYPAFLASLVIGAAYYCFVREWMRFDPWMFLGNLAFFNAKTGYSYVSWSLGYEFAYYLVLPVVLLLARALGTKLAAIAMLAIALAVLPTEYIRGYGLFAGTIIAAWSDDELKAFARKIPLVLVIAAYASPLVLRGAGIALGDYITFYRLFLPAAMLLFVKVVFDQTLLTGLLSSTPLRLLGTISYSFYLFHPIVIASVMYDVLIPMGLYQSRLFVPLLVGLSLVATGTAALISYLVFERAYFRIRVADHLPTAGSSFPA
jgi:peptidoglycan/LPS O-acetylase OafA/YrhL